MHISEQAIDAALLLTVEGQLDSTTSRELEDTLCARMQVHSAVIIDMRAVQYVSSAGLRVLLKAAKIARGASHRLVLFGLAPNVSEVFDISGFSGIFRIEPDLAQAQAAAA